MGSGQEHGELIGCYLACDVLEFLGETADMWASGWSDGIRACEVAFEAAMKLWIGANN